MKMDWSKLRGLITEHFDLEEFRTLCFDLNVDFDSLPGEGKESKIREFIAKLKRERRIPDLIDKLVELRPHIKWRDLIRPIPKPDSSKDRLKPIWPTHRRKIWLIGSIASVLFISSLIIRQVYNSRVDVRVDIETPHNNYVTAMGSVDDWLIQAPPKKKGDEFILHCYGNGKASFHTEPNVFGLKRYFTATDGSPWDWRLRGNRLLSGINGKFTLIDDVENVNDDGMYIGKPKSCLEVIRLLKQEGEVLIALQTSHKKDGFNRLVTAMDNSAHWDWELRAETIKLQASEKFTVTLITTP